MPERTLASYRSPNWINLLLAVWLFLSPWIVAPVAMGPWAWNLWIVAVIVGGLSIAALAQLAEWEEWINLILGAWLFVSPWLFGYANMIGDAWNSWIVGILIAADAIWGIVAARQAMTHANVPQAR